MDAVDSPDRAVTGARHHLRPKTVSVHRWAHTDEDSDDCKSQGSVSEEQSLCEDGLLYGSLPPEHSPSSKAECELLQRDVEARLSDVQGSRERGQKLLLVTSLWVVAIAHALQAANRLLPQHAGFMEDRRTGE